MHPAADAVFGRGEFLDRAVGAAAAQGDAPAFRGPRFGPVDRVAVARDLTEADRFADDQIGGDRRFPGSKRGDRHVAHCFRSDRVIVVPGSYKLGGYRM